MQVYGTHYLADRRHSVQSMPRGISDMAGDEARMLQTYHCHVAEDIGNLRGASQQFPASHKAQSCTRHPGCLFVHIDATIALSRVRFAVFRAGMPMAHVAPKGRTPRSAEAFLGWCTLVLTISPIIGLPMRILRSPRPSCPPS